MKEFILNFLRNCAILFVIGVVLFLVAPQMMSQVFGVYGALGVPFVLLFIIMAALPRRKRYRGKY